MGSSPAPSSGPVADLSRAVQPLVRINVFMGRQAKGIWPLPNRSNPAERARRRPKWRRPGAVATAAASCLWLASCQTAVLDPRGPVGGAERTILLDSLAIMLAIVVPVIVGVLGFAWWFRAGNRRATFLPTWAYSGRLELITWSIPVLVILFLGGMTWVGSHELDPAEPLKSAAKPIEVQVVSLDWKWLFIYPESGVASVNRLVVPAGTPIHFSLTSASVLNSFFVPQLGSMIYTMNGMSNQLNLQADAPGVYAGLSAHYSGDGFSNMHFDVQAVPGAQFSQWIAAAKAQGPVLDEPGYGRLSRQSSNVAPFTYRATDPGLYQRIVAQRIAPGPGPEAGQPDVSVHPKQKA
jgi:cytochrome o ubiquinol oxidase subunit 2